MSKVFVNIAMSLDGYMAPDGMTLENWENPGYKNWGANWGALMAWLLPLQALPRAPRARRRWRDRPRQ